jgi:hypothetical protein
VEVLLVAGRFSEAVPALERAAVAKDQTEHDAVRYQRLIPRARRLAGRLGAGGPTSGDPAGPAVPTAADQAARAASEGRPALAAWIYEVIFEALPSRADDLKAGNRDRAARAAALAGCGRGEDDPKPDDAERAELRKLALGWLRADLAARRKLIEAGDSQERAGVAQTLRRWKEGTDLTGIRDAESLARLPEVEREEWQALWAAVDALLARAGDIRP